MCPVSAGIAIATNAAVIAAVGATGAVVAGVAAGAAVGAAIGVGVSGVVNVATGRGFFENAGTSAIFGAIGGGIGAGLGIGSSSVLLSQGTVGIDTFHTFGEIAASGFAPTGTGIALTAAAGSLLTPPQLPTFSTPVQTQGVAQLQQYSSQQLKVTGSGGVQAAASLAEAIKRSKSRRLTQRDVGDLSIDTASFAGTGLQFA